MNILESGKVAVGYCDAQWGSSGKGKLNGLLAKKEEPDFAISQNSVQSCLAGDIYVETDREIKKLEDIVNEGELNIGVFDKDGVVEKPEKLFDVGVRDTLKLVLSNGMEFFPTPNHKWKVWDGNKLTDNWVRSDELDPNVHQFMFPKESSYSVDEYVKINFDNRLKKPDTNMISLPNEITEKEGFIFGLLVGSGYYPPKEKDVVTILFRKDQMYNLKLVEEWFSSIGVSVKGKHINPNVLRIASSELRQWLIKCGIFLTNGENKNTPLCVWKSPKSVMAAYLAGLIESKGCVNDRVTVVSNISENVVKDTQILCNILGIRTKLRVNIKHKNEKAKPLWDLHIGGYFSLKKLYDVVPLTTKKDKLGSLLSKKSIESHNNKKYNSRIIINDKVTRDKIRDSHASKAKNRVNDTTIISSKLLDNDLITSHYFYNIKSVSPHKPLKVFDMTIPNSHSYMANGTYSHNSHIYVDSDGSSFKFQHLPTSVVCPSTDIYIGAGACIDLKQLKREIDQWEIDETRLKIHPNAVVITEDDVQYEREQLLRIASTMTGNGAALARKVMRHPNVTTTSDVPELKPFISDITYEICERLKRGERGVLETAQGFDLSLDHGMLWTNKDGSIHKAFPYNTSRNVDVMTFAGMSGLPKRVIGKVLMNVRSFPIRVGDASNNEKDGYSGISMKGSNSGPYYPDQEELTWDEVTDIALSNVPIMEMTSLTKRIRRVFSFSMMQYRLATMVIDPDFICLNFANYLEASIKDKSGVYSINELAEEYPIIAEFVVMLNENQYWGGGKVNILGTGAGLNHYIEIDY